METVMTDPDEFEVDWSTASLIPGRRVPPGKTLVRVMWRDGAFERMKFAHATIGPNGKPDAATMEWL